MLAVTEVKRTSHNLCKVRRHSYVKERCCNAPLLFDHFQEITVIDNALKYRTQGESIMTTEGGGESNDRDDMRELG
jgi:hypothetical protein